MRIVAEHLERETMLRSDEAEIDLFGRSAFNRYYYATFWIVRRTLKAIDPQWAEPAHSVIPQILRGTLRNRIGRQIRLNVIPHLENEQLRARANTSLSDLANLLEQAYLLRVEADYKPESTATIEGSTIRMAGAKSSEAARWPKLAETHTGNILDVCKKLGII